MDEHIFLDSINISDRLAARSRALTDLYGALKDSHSTDPRMARLVDATRTYASVLAELSREFRDQSLPNIHIDLLVEDAEAL